MAPRSGRISPLLLGTASIFVVIVGLIFVMTRPQDEVVSPAELFPSGEIRIGVDASFPPFAFTTEDGLAGIDIELGRAIGERLGLPVRFVNMGFDGLYDSLKADQVDILISALLVDPARQDNVLYTRSYFDAGLVLVSAPGNRIESMEALPGNALAYEFGSAADAEARRWLRRVEPFATQPYELPEHALDAVRLGAADAALVDAISARLYLREHADAWDAGYHYVTQALFALAARRDRGAQWASINRALQSLLDDGVIDTLLRRWL